jgi:hypothetical protein
MRTGLMTKLFAGLVVVLVAVVAAQFASSATSRSTKSVPARVKALEQKVKGLSASINTLKGKVATLQTRADCLGAQGVTQWGNPAAGQGYIYTNDGGTTAFITTGFDAPAQGQTPRSSRRRSTRRASRARNAMPSSSPISRATERRGLPHGRGSPGVGGATREMSHPLPHPDLATAGACAAGAARHGRRRRLRSR